MVHLMMQIWPTTLHRCTKRDMPFNLGVELSDKRQAVVVLERPNRTLDNSIGGISLLGGIILGVARQIWIQQ